MIKIEFDYRELENYAKSVGATADQIPFALALAMNRSADVTRNFLIKQTWPTHVVQRNASFIAASLTTKDARSFMSAWWWWSGPWRSSPRPSSSSSS